MAEHRAPIPEARDRAARWTVSLATATVVGLITGMIAASATTTTPTLSPINCAPGVNLIVQPNGTWRCDTPAPSPTLPPLTQSPTPSASPSTSPTPTPSATQPTTSPSPSASPTPSPTPSPTASPTPSPTGGRLNRCLPRLAECDYPHPGNTGVPTNVVLTPYTGPSVITTANTVIDGKTLGCITIRAVGVVIQNSRITGPCFYAVQTEGSGVVTVRDSVVDCVNHKGTGFVWRNYTVRRTQILNCENGFHTSGNVDVRDSYISGVQEVDGGHGDGVQGSSGSNYTFIHNTFDLRNPITSSFIWDDQTMHNVLIEDNFVMAGAYTIYCPSAGSNVVYRNNRFYAPVGNWQSDPARPAFGFWTNCGSWITRTGNFRDDTLAAV